MKSVSKIMGKFFVGLFKNLGIPVVLMVGMLSLATKKFPPPLKEYWTGLQAIQSGPQLQDTMKSVSELKQQQAMAMEAIDGGTRSLASTTLEPGGEFGKKLKSLEYEVAYYKAKFARSEWEKQQLEQKLAKQSTTTDTKSK